MVFLMLLSLLPNNLFYQQSYLVQSNLFYFCFLNNFMIPSFPSSQNLRPVPHTPNRNHLYTNIPFNNIRYRLRTNQFIRINTAITLWALFWFAVSFFIAGYLLQKYLTQLQSLYLIFAGGFIGTLPLAYNAWIKRKNSTGNMVKLSIASLCAYLFLCTILEIFGKDLLLYPTIFYISGQFVGSMMFLSDRSHFFGKLLLLLQLLFIILKADSRIKSQWEQTMFGFIIAFFICGAVLVSMLAFFTINRICFKEGFNTIKHKGLAYISIQTLGFLALSGIPTFACLFDLKNELFSTVMFAITLLINFYSNRFRSEIILFLCRTQKIKNNNQMISLLKIPPKKYQNFVFIEKSESWCQLIQKKQLEKKLIKEKYNDQTLRDIRQIGDEKCLVCFEEDPVVVWMPCGHKCVCEACAFQMFNFKSSCCVLCKDIPEAIYIVNKGTKRRQEKKEIEEVVVDIQQDMRQEEEKKKNEMEILEIDEAYSIMIN